MMDRRNYERITALLLFCISLTLSAQQPTERSEQDRAVHLNVEVTPRSGGPVGGLQQSDFTVMDNKTVRSITSFKAVDRGQEKVEVILLMDAANTRFQTVAYEQGELQKFLKSGEGRLANPTTIAVLTDQGIQIQPEFTADGNTLSHSLDHYSAGLREIRRSSGFWGADERLQISLSAVHQLASFAARQPGRKIVIWISPGWPLLSGPGIDLDAKQQDQIFANIVSLSAELRQANITLYDVNPLGPGEDLVRADYYQEFLKGVSKPRQTQLGNLGLQVLAVQSGGLTLQSTSDIASMVKRCVADTEHWYEITFPAAPAEQPSEYHHIEVKLAQPDLSARTRDGYYAQP